VRSTDSLRFTFTSLAFAIALVVAVAGGWLVYRAVGPPVSQWGVAAPQPNTIGSGCSGHHLGPVRFLRVWARGTQVARGRSITVHYTIANDAKQCRDVRLGATAQSVTRPGVVFRDPAGERVVAALPGVHTYRRSFVFPAPAAGQRVDVLLMVGSPSRATTYGVIRLNHPITVRR
jgi:hypothetical protein